MELRGVTLIGERIDALTLSEPILLEKCKLQGGSIGLTRRPVDRLTVRNITARKCSIDSVIVGPVVFENVAVQDLRTTSHLWLPACAFRHCTLSGRIGRLLFFASEDPGQPLSSVANAPFFKANAAYYAETDWALDISAATFVDWDCRSVPAALIRVNPNTQIRVSYEKTRQRLATGELRGLSVDGQFTLEWSLKHREDTCFDFVLVTNPCHRDYEEMMSLFDYIHREGLSSG